MTTSTQAMVRRAHDSDAVSVLVRGRRAPLDDFDSVATFDAGAIAMHEWKHTYLPLYVTTPTSSGRVRARFDTRTVPDAIEHVKQLLSKRDFEGFWLRYHAGFVDCWHERRVAHLEARFAAIAAETGTTFVTWTDETTSANEAVYDEIYEGVIES